MNEIPSQHREGREGVPPKGKYPVPLVRVMAGVEPEHLGKTKLPGEKVQDYREHLKYLARNELAQDEHITGLTNEHIVQASRESRTPVSENEIANENSKWANKAAEWLLDAPDEVKNRVAGIFRLDSGDNQESGGWTVTPDNLADQLNQLRSRFFDSQRPGGDLDVDEVIDFLAYGDGVDGEWDPWKPVSLETLIEDLSVIEPFLYVFGDEKTVELIKDRALAQAALEEIRSTPEAERDKVIDEVASVLEQEISDDEAKHYRSGPSESTTLMVHDVPVAEAAPFNEGADTAGHEVADLTPPPSQPQSLEPAPPGDAGGEWHGGETTRRGGAFGEGGAMGAVVPGEGEGGGEKNVAPETPERVLTFAEFQELSIDRALEGYPELKAWFEQERAKLPELQVEVGEGPVTNGNDWNAEYVMGADGKVEGVHAITNTRRFFTLKGVKIRKEKGVNAETGEKEFIEWTQPGLLEEAVEVEVETAFGKAKLRSSGLVGVIKDREGNVLAAIDQEPLADTPNHVVVKDPLQTSMGKFLGIKGDPEKGIAPDPSKDPGFLATLKLIFGEEDPFGKLLEHLKQPDVVWPMGPVNGNRLNSPNVTFEIVVDDDKKEALTLNGKNRWVSEPERKALERAGLLNLIGTGAFTAV